MRNIPSVYWILQFYLIEISNRKVWRDFYKPAAELSGQIANPQVYKEYFEHQRREERKKKEKEKLQKMGKSGSFYYENQEKTMNAEYTYSESEASTHYDPNLGIVDEQGKVIIPKDKCNSMLGYDGAMISY